MFKQNQVKRKQILIICMLVFLSSMLGNMPINAASEKQAAPATKLSPYHVWRATLTGTTPPAAPAIKLNPETRITRQVTVTISSYPLKAVKKYYYIDSGSYRNYIGSFKVDQNCTIYTGYITAEGKYWSHVTYRQITNIRK